MKDYCRNYARVAWSTPHPETKYVSFTRLRCKSWHCDYCASVNSRMWQAHLLDNINKLSDETMRWSFLTMTSPEYIREPHASYHAVNNAWRKLTELWRSLHRAYGGLNLLYARTLEAHQDGAVHLHAVIGHDLPLHGYVNINHAKKFKKNNKTYFDKPRFRGRMTWRIQDLAKLYGAGYKTELDSVYRANAGLVVSYITKYITKENQTKLDLPKGARRVLTSQQFSQFGKFEDASVVTWRVEKEMLWEDYLHIEKSAECIKDLQTSEPITLASFDNGRFYPPLSDKNHN